MGGIRKGTIGIPVSNIATVTRERDKSEVWHWSSYKYARFFQHTRTLPETLEICMRDNTAEGIEVVVRAEFDDY